MAGTFSRSIPTIDPPQGRCEPLDRTWAAYPSVRRCPPTKAPQTPPPHRPSRHPPPPRVVQQTVSGGGGGGLLASRPEEWPPPWEAELVEHLNWRTKRHCPNCIVIWLQERIGGWWV